MSSYGDGIIESLREHNTREMERRLAEITAQRDKLGRDLADAECLLRAIHADCDEGNVHGFGLAWMIDLDDWIAKNG